MYEVSKNNIQKQTCVNRFKKYNFDLDRKFYFIVFHVS